MFSSRKTENNHRRSHAIVLLFFDDSAAVVRLGHLPTCAFHLRHSSHSQGPNIRYGSLPSSDRGFFSTSLKAIFNTAHVAIGVSNAWNPNAVSWLRRKHTDLDCARCCGRSSRPSLFGVHTANFPVCSHPLRLRHESRTWLHCCHIVQCPVVFRLLLGLSRRLFLNQPATE